MNGAFASLARRRAISVLPTPVGPIIKMFFGVISPRSGSAICARRQRLRSAIATARFASAWPTMCLSSSSTISRGVIDMASELFDRDLAVRVDADVGRYAQRFLDDRARAELRLVEQRARRGLRVRAAGADREQLMLGLDHVARARDEQRLALVGDDQERLEPAQHPVRAPVLRELDRGAREVAVLRELGLEILEKRERVRRAAREARDHPAVGEAADLARVALDDLLTQSDLAVAAERDAAVAPDADDRRAVKFRSRHAVLDIGAAEPRAARAISRGDASRADAPGRRRARGAGSRDACRSESSTGSRGRASPARRAGPRSTRAGASRTSAAACAGARP